MDEENIFITAEESGERIDALLARNLEGFSRNAIQKLIESGNITRNGDPIRKNEKSVSGQTYEIALPPLEAVDLIAQDIPLDIVYEDEALIVVNKPRGLVVHPAPGHPDGTLVNALLYHCGSSLSGIGGEKRPGIVHRIDKDTSGLIVIAKNDAAHRALSAQLADRSLSREYAAVVHGHLKDSTGCIDKPIGRSPADRKKMGIVPNGKPARTHWKVLTEYRDYSYIECKLETGRTHQIRVHMASIGHPLLGDSLYGAPSPEKGLEGQCLHARRIQFIHPLTNESMHFETALPEYFMQVLSKLGPSLSEL